MQRDDTAFEHTLGQSRPVGLDSHLLDRLAVALDAASAATTEIDGKTEVILAAKRPAALSANFMARLEGLVEAVPREIPEPEAARIIPFRRYAAAAAIALAGAAVALLAPMQDGHSDTAGRDGTIPAAPTQDARHFVPAAHARGLSEARDEGVIWKDNTPHRVLRIVYTDTITLRNDSGEIVEVEQPRVEYIVVPQTTD